MFIFVELTAGSWRETCGATSSNLDSRIGGRVMCSSRYFFPSGLVGYLKESEVKFGLVIWKLLSWEWSVFLEENFFMMGLNDFTEGSGYFLVVKLPNLKKAS